MSNSPFGGGQTGTGGSPINGPQMPAGQFGGNKGQYACISIGNYVAALAALQSSPLKILYEPGSFVAISRMSNGAIDTAGSIRDLRALEALYSYQYLLQDSPPLELQAQFVLAAAPDAITNGAVNVQEFLSAYDAAITYALAVAFMTTWLGNFQTGRWTAISNTEAAERLAAIGIQGPAAS